MVGSIYILALALIACAYGQQPSNEQIINSVFGGNATKVNLRNEQQRNESANVRSSC